MYINRDIEKLLTITANSFQVIVIYGPRQVGKSTTVDYVFGSNYNYVTLDDSDDLFEALNNPKGFIQTHPWPLIIDEVQKAPKLLDEIKIQIDEQRKIWLKNNQKRELMYILTGSNQFELQQGISESLAGRAAIFDMSSMTQIEALHKNGSLFIPDIDKLIVKEKRTDIEFVNKNVIFERIFRGGMPDIVTGESERDSYFKSYIDTYINKDVKKLIAASSEMQFRRFISYLALRTAQQVEYSTYASDLGIDVDTVKRWMSILITSGIIILLEPFMSNISKRIIKSPKLYFMDTGLCSYLCRWPNSIMLKDGVMNGAFFETFVVSEIIKSFYNNNLDYKTSIYYYRDIDQKEVDIIYYKDNKIYPIEIKKGESPTKPNKNFKVLSKYNLEIMPGLVIDSCDKIRSINENAYTFPIHLLGIL